MGSNRKRMGIRLAEMREAAGLSQQELGERIKGGPKGVRNQNWISTRETGEVSRLDEADDEVRQIAEACGYVGGFILLPPGSTDRVVSGEIDHLLVATDGAPMEAVDLAAELLRAWPHLRTGTLDIIRAIIANEASPAARQIR